MYVSYEYSSHCKNYWKVKYLLLVAISSMVFRAFLLGSIINPSIIPWLLPLILTSTIGYTLGAMKGRNATSCVIRVKSPLSFRFAIFYTIFFSSILFIAHLASDYFGSYGVYALSAFVGLVDVSSLAIALATMQLAPIVIARGILILTTMNVIGNWLMTMIFGNKKFAFETIRIELIPLITNGIILTSTFLF